MWVGDLSPDVFVPFLIFTIPIIAIIGGLTAGIIRTLGRQRLIELAQQERIAAIQRGVDPSKLPPLPSEGGGVWDTEPWGSPYESAKRRAQGLLIGGLVTLFVGVGIAAFLLILGEEAEHHIWAVGIIPGMVGLALLISARIVWPRRDDGAPRA